MVLESTSFCITEAKAKGEVHFKHGRLISEDAAKMFAEGSWSDRGQAKIILVLKSVLPAESGANLWPMLSIGVCYVFFGIGNEV